MGVEGAFEALMAPGRKERATGLIVEVALIAAVGIVLAGCSTAGGSTRGGQSASLPDGRPNITGTITEVERGGEALRVLVEEDPRQGKTENCLKEGCDKLFLDITGDTRIIREASGEEEAFAPARAADLEKGQRVRAWHSGVVSKSYPGQAKAQVVVIDEMS